MPRALSAAWPSPINGTAYGKRFRAGPVSVEALSLPDHSADSLGLLFPDEVLLLPGDHLSPCEIPRVEDIEARRATPRRLRILLEGLDQVIPGHGPELDRAAAATILEADLRYLDAVAKRAARDDTAAALSMPLPRAEPVPDVADRHRENCTAARLVIESDRQGN